MEKAQTGRRGGKGGDISSQGLPSPAVAGFHESAESGSVRRIIGPCTCGDQKSVQGSIGRDFVRFLTCSPPKCLCVCVCVWTGMCACVCPFRQCFVSNHYVAPIDSSRPLVSGERGTPTNSNLGLGQIDTILIPAHFVAKEKEDGCNLDSLGHPEN